MCGVGERGLGAYRGSGRCGRCVRGGWWGGGWGGRGGEGAGDAAKSGEPAKTVGIGDRRDIDLLRLLQPHDLIKYGFIPEFIGRMPVVATLEDLDKTALIQILTKPKNAIIKQYQRLFEYENVRLRFS